MGYANTKTVSWGVRLKHQTADVIEVLCQDTSLSKSRIMAALVRHAVLDTIDPEVATVLNALAALRGEGEPHGLTERVDFLEAQVRALIAAQGGV